VELYLNQVSRPLSLDEAVGILQGLLPQDLNNEAAMTIKPLDGSVVMCEKPGCDRSAVYLFTQTNPELICVAYCESHGVPFAKRLELALPPIPKVTSKR
jgi:hypothetical protein